ncbi:MAG: AbrB/MazE/SpoVT family DNA-binding domain-containing protein [Clostridia bacterium]|nr:AbrB/MazE/SpoVT family DNA-binding domain-containing protein [Clostridia bacterium]
MGNVFRNRKIDNLGRIVIPMDIRKALDIREWDELCIRLEQEQILITKAHDTCTFCGCVENLIPFGEKHLCADCLEQLKKA